MEKYFIFILLFFNVLSVSAQSINTVGIISREPFVQHFYNDKELSRNEKNWIKNKKKLILAIPQPDNPPFDITLRSLNYEGVSADVVGLISSALNIPIVTKIYKDRSAALAAIRNGEADIISTSNIYEESAGFLLTDAYISDNPSLYMRQGIHREQIENVAVSKYYLPAEEIRRILPGKNIVIYPNKYSAVASVVYQKNDAVLTDSVSANFIINKFYQDTLRFDRFLSIKTKGFSFALEQHNYILKDIINKAVSGISENQKNNLLKRWSGGGISLKDNGFMLSIKDEKYLKNFDKIIIGVNGFTPPMSFIDLDDNFRGVVADISQYIKARLGVKVEIRFFKTLKEQHDALKAGVIDLTILSPNLPANKSYSFTRSIALDPLVFVVRKKDENKFNDIKGIIKTGSVGMVNNSVAQILIGNGIDSQSSIKFFNSFTQSLKCVDTSSCSAVIMPLRTAQYYINGYYPRRLAIAGELFDSKPVSASFAGLSKNAHLIKIIDKLILSISPDELDTLAGRWRVSVKEDASVFDDVIRQFGGVIISIVVMLFLIVCWAFSLRYQNNKIKLAETELKQQLKFMRALIDSIPHPVFSRNNFDEITICNKSYSDWLCVDKDNLIGMNRSNLPISDKSKSDLEIIYKEFYENGETYAADHTLEFKDGRTFNIYYWLSAYRDISGNVAGLIGGWLDISERTRLLKDLSEASEIAKEANKAKSTFLATMSHEIRTPMNAIIGLLELTLRKDGVDDESRDYVQVAYNSSKDLLRLIGDILDISKIESGKLELIPAPHSIAELSQSVIKVFYASAREKALTLDYSIENDSFVMIDPIRYKQILSNLISNAIKFTDSGGVCLDIKLSIEGHQCYVTLNVEDTGIGISKDDQVRLFQPFSQASNVANDAHSGTGLGLMISRNLCEMMGGHLELVSVPNKGTIVTMSLCVPVVSSFDRDGQKLFFSEGQQEIKSLVSQVLIIDDHPTNRLLVCQQLTFLGHEVTVAQSGRNALQILATQHFDFIITDFNMPDINGLEFTKRYRELEVLEKRERSIIIGLTADARQEQIQHAIESGMDDCLFKPASLDEIKQCLAIHDHRPDLNYLVTIAERIDEVLGRLSPGKTGLMFPLVQEFLLATDDDLAALAIACNDNDTQRFLDLLHRIKGGARIIGADQLVRCCTDWEQSPRLSWCMRSVVRQLDIIYGHIREAISYWERSRSIH